MERRAITATTTATHAGVPPAPPAVAAAAVPPPLPPRAPYFCQACTISMTPVKRKWRVVAEAVNSLALGFLFTCTLALLERTMDPSKLKDAAMYLAITAGGCMLTDFVLCCVYLSCGFALHFDDMCIQCDKRQN